MTGFSADWLALRAPFDARARAAALNVALAAWLTNRTAKTGEAARAIDLGAGSGNNARYLTRHLDQPIAWTFVDGDGRLLDQARKNHPQAEIVEADLSGDLKHLIPDGTDLVTASALIDLVSEPWLERLVKRVRAVGAALMIVLTYDGRITWSEPEPMDTAIRELVNRHQQTDKGFGPALGPTAPGLLERLLDDQALTADSDWAISADDTTMRQALVEGWCGAAIEIAPTAADRIRNWRDRTGSRRSDLTVGHRDHLWLPPG